MITISNIKRGIEAIIMFALSVIVFEIVVQPVLVFIHPMFSDQLIISLTGRGGSTPPAEIALLVTMLVVFVLYWAIRPIFKAVISVYIIDRI